MAVKVIISYLICRDQEISEAKSRLQEQESTVEEAKRQCQNAIEEATAAVGGAQTAETRAAECQAALEKCKLASQRNQEVLAPALFVSCSYTLLFFT
jgi:sRNA-binding protein